MPPPSGQIKPRELSPGAGSGAILANRVIMPGFFTTAVLRCKRSFAPGWRTTAFLFAIPWLFQAVPGDAAARTLHVGPNRILTGPAKAAAVAQDGDHVVFDPGVYNECAVWTASRLTLDARRLGTIITGPPCADRALFLFIGNDIVVRGLTFQRAHDKWHTGAGILMEGRNLLVEDGAFLDNENGILAGAPLAGPQANQPESLVRVRRSLFRGNGSCEGACAHGIYVGFGVTRLEVINSAFTETRMGHHIKSRARVTIVTDSRIEDGPKGTSSYLINLPNGGRAEILNNILQKGALSGNRSAAISAGEENNVFPAAPLEVRGNTFTSELSGQVIFVRNRAPGPAHLQENTFKGRVIPLDGAGTVE